MYSSYQRINNISAFVSSCLMGLLVAISVTSYAQLWSIGEPVGSLSVKPMGVYVILAEYLVCELTSTQPKSHFSAVQQKRAGRRILSI
jgi:hypothetical protein